MARWRQVALAIALFAIVLTFGACGGDGDEDPTPTTQLPTQGPKLTATPYAEVVPTPAPGTTDGWLTYENQEFGYAIEYPAGTEVTENFSREVAVENPGPGTILDMPRPSGTNLAEKFVYITVTDAADGCLPIDPVGTTTLADTQFAHGRILAGMASHGWSGDVYAAVRGSSCVTINAVLGSVSMGVLNDDVEEFDRGALQADLDAVVATFRWLD